jgi:hypothetical protein
MAQDPEGQDGRPDAVNIRGVLESNGIQWVTVDNELYPILGVEIRVARADLERAQAVIAEALAAGPEAAAEAEAETEP